MAGPMDAITAIHNAFRRDMAGIDAAALELARGKAERAAAVERGKRLDESRPGSGLGLSIVVDLASIYGGSLELDESPLGGLRAILRLPCA